MPLILGTNSIKDTGYEVANSCRFNRADGAYMHKTPGSAGNQKTMTFSCWVKRSQMSAETYFLLSAGVDASNRDAILYQDQTIRVLSQRNESDYWLRSTTRVFRDPSAWTHIVVSIDTTQGTDSNRIKIYINGTQETTFNTYAWGDAYPAEDFEMYFNDDLEQAVGSYAQATPGNHFDGYMAEVVMIDGTAYAASDFGEFDTDGSPTIWKPKDASGLTFGTNGFYLDFEDSSNLGNDANGGTDLTEANLAATDSSTDTPTNNFATMNPLDNYIQNQTFAEGNLQTLSDNPSPATSTIGMTAGKWWIEAKAVSTSGSGSDYQIGIISNQVIATEDLGHYSNNYAYYYDGNSKTGNSSSSYGDSYTHGDIIGIAVNLDDNELKFYKNGTVQNSGTAISITAPASTSLGAYFFALGADANANKYTWYINFGNPIWSLSSAVADENGYGSFEYAPPSGFLALCTKNLGSDGG